MLLLARRHGRLALSCPCLHWSSGARSYPRDCTCGLHPLSIAAPRPNHLGGSCQAALWKTFFDWLSRTHSFRWTMIGVASSRVTHTARILVLALAAAMLSTYCMMPSAAKSYSILATQGYCRPSDTECNVAYNGTFRGATSSCQYSIHSACGLSLQQCQARCSGLKDCQGVAFSPTDDMNHCSTGTYSQVPKAPAGDNPSGISKCVTYVGGAAIVQTEYFQVISDFSCYKKVG